MTQLWRVNVDRSFWAWESSVPMEDFVPTNCADTQARFGLKVKSHRDLSLLLRRTWARRSKSSAAQPPFQLGSVILLLPPVIWQSPTGRLTTSSYEHTHIG